MSVTVEVPDAPVIRRENQTVVGVDVGIAALATLSTGEKIRSPKAYAAATQKLRRLSQQFRCRSHRNMIKTARRIARWHARIANIRANALNPWTTMLGERFDVIGTEDLNVAGMLKNHTLSRATKDMGLGEFRRQLTYKAAPRGKTVGAGDRWYPSSKTCSPCGYKQGEMPLAVRAWTCPACGRPANGPKKRWHEKAGRWLQFDQLTNDDQTGISPSEQETLCLRS